jgi:hypothetical protein
MNIKRTWIVTGATLAMAGFAGAGIAMASDSEVRDPRHAPVVQLTGDEVSANTADSPDEPGHVPPAPAPQAADSSDTPAAPPPAPPQTVDSANTPDSDASAD